MPFKKGDIVGKVGDPSVHGIVIELQYGKDKTDVSYFVKFYKVDKPGEYTAETYDEGELIRKNSQPYKNRLANLDQGPPSGGSKSRRRSRKNKRTRRARR